MWANNLLLNKSATGIRRHSASGAIPERRTWRRNGTLPKGDARQVSAGTLCQQTLWKTKEVQSEHGDHQEAMGKESEMQMWYGNCLPRDSHIMMDYMDRSSGETNACEVSVCSSRAINTEFVPGKKGAKRRKIMGEPSSCLTQTEEPWEEKSNISAPFKCPWKSAEQRI